jgi:hypothetical protein
MKQVIKGNKGTINAAGGDVRISKVTNLSFCVVAIVTLGVTGFGLKLMLSGRGVSIQQQVTPHPSPSN